MSNSAAVGPKRNFYETIRLQIDKGVFDRLGREEIITLITIYELNTRYNRKELIVSEIAAATPLSRPSIFRAIETLLSLGLIETEVIEIGARTFKKVKLTDLGKEIAELLIKARDLYKERTKQQKQQ